jgi:YVTN family beta-propeller protein
MTVAVGDAQIAAVICSTLQQVNLRLTAAVLASSLLLAVGCTRPGFPAYPDGVREFAYVANSAANTVTILDLVYLRPDRTIPVGIDPVAIAVNPARDEVYVVNAQPEQASGSVSVIDTVKNAVVATIAVHRDPTAIAVDGTGQRAFVVNTGSNTVSVLDLGTRRAIAAIATGDKPAALALAQDERTLVVSNRASGSVSVYSVGIPPPSKSKTPIPPLTLRNTFTGCPGASDAVILPDSSKAFIACSAANQVMSIWLAAAPDSWNARLDASLTGDHVLAMLDVGHNPTNLTLKPDGGEVFASNRDSDSISEINTQNNEVASTYSIGNRPAHAIVSHDNDTMWVSTLGSQTISLYSIADGKVLRECCQVGTSPDALAFSSGEQMLLAADTKSGDVAVIRTASKPVPVLFTILAAGGSPSAIAVKQMAAPP